MGFAAVIALSGCASPGPPLPPTLNLPQVVSGTGLTAMRVGDEVRLHWTTPTQTTDKLPIKGSIVAEICREVVTVPAARSLNPPCHPTTRAKVATGGSDAVDALPATLTSGPARLLSYRVRLLNASGRTAGPSQAAFAVAGATVGPVEDFSGNTTKAGVLLRWKADAQGSGNSEQGTAGGSTVELDRTALDLAPETGGKARKGGLPGAQKQAAETRFQGAAANAGGVIDRTTEMGHSYRYTAQRVDAIELGGKKLELRSVPTQALEVAVRDEFPPDVPAGLVAEPGLAGEGEGQRPTIELSWEPDVEARVAGYRVYRRELSADRSGDWVRIGLVTMAAYRDLTVVAGHRYAYRVTAVSTAGNESGPSGEAVEIAPRQ